MNNRTKMILVAVAFAATTSSLSSQAQSYSTTHTDQENAWLEAERERGNTRSFADIPFPVPPTKAVATNSRPETARQAAENKFLTRERNETDGNVAPVQFPSSGAASPTAGK